MQINSVNSPAFGCGACAAAYKKAVQLTKIPASIEAGMGFSSEQAVKATRKAIKFGEFINSNKTHGQVASIYNKFMGERIRKLATKI